jgi:hypothetical protein
VSAGPAEILTLTAAHLAAAGIAVEADTFATVRGSRSMDKFTTVLGERDAAVQEIFELERDLAPVEAGSEAPTAGDLLAAKVAAPARAVRDYARQVIAEVDASTAALLQAPEGGQAPLYTAARLERLQSPGGATDRITHVLYVCLDGIAADVVTRNSLLGASGLLRFIAAGNASWSLLDTATGQVIAGGQERHGDVMAFSIESGEAHYSDTPDVPKAANPLTAPSRTAEYFAKALVVILAVVLAAFGVLSIIAVVRVALH